MPDEPEQRTTTSQDEADLGGMSPAAVRLEEVHQRLRDESHDPNAPGSPEKAPPETPEEPAPTPAQASAYAAMHREIQAGKARIDTLIRENEELQSAREELQRSGAVGPQAPAQPKALGALAERIASMTGDDPGAVSAQLRDAIFEVVGPAANQLFGYVGDGAIEKERAAARSDPDYSVWGSDADQLVNRLPPQARLAPNAYAEAKIYARGIHFDALVQKAVERALRPGTVVGRFDGRFVEGAAPGSEGAEEPALSAEGEGWIRRNFANDPQRGQKIAQRAAEAREAREARGRPKRSGSGGF